MSPAVVNAALVEREWAWANLGGGRARRGPKAPRSGADRRGRRRAGHWLSRYTDGQWSPAERRGDVKVLVGSDGMGGRRTLPETPEPSGAANERS